MRGFSEPLLQEPHNLGCNETRIATGFINRIPQPVMWSPRHGRGPDIKLGFLGRAVYRSGERIATVESVVNQVVR